MKKTGGQRVGTHIVRIALILCVLLMPVLGANTRLIHQIDDELIALRFQAAPRAASGSMVFIAIDKKSLDDIGVWPWPRSVYASVIDKLTAAGAADLFIDVDFSTPSSPSEDKRLAKALADAGGSVILPVFHQLKTADAASDTVLTRPVAELADNAWLAFANVIADPDGAVRSFMAGGDVDGTPTQSAPAVLARSDRVTGRLPIDFSIDPATVPTYSLSSVLDGSVGANEINGRAVVVGAYATELKDIFPVPVYGLMPGPMLHIIAAETLLQGRLLEPAPQLQIDLFLAAIIAAMVLLLRKRRLVPVMAVSVVLFVVGEAGAYLLQRDNDVLLHTTTWWTMLGLGLFMLMNEKVDFAALLLDIAKSEHRNTRRLLKRIVTDSTDGVIAFDNGMRVIEESKSVRPLLGLAPANGRGVPLDLFLPVALMTPVAGLVSRYAVNPGKVHSLTVDFALPQLEQARHLEATITVSPIETKNDDGIESDKGFVGCLIIRDVTAHQLYQDRLERLSRYDDLTGLLNGREFIRRLDDVTEPCHVAVLDLHRFANVNSALGRDRGDQLLKAVAARLERDAVDGLVGRLGGDVFCLALPMRDGFNEAQFAERLLDVFKRPFELGGSRLQAAVRLGLCARISNEIDAARSIACCEHALHDAKGETGSAWRTYDTASADRRNRARQLERELHPAFERGEFYLLYQPQVDLKSAVMTGAEALIRWQNRELGPISPVDFIEIAEANGFICELGEWVLNEACREAARWPDALTIAVNVSPVQIQKGDFFRTVVAALQASGLAPQRLHLEITETAFIDGRERIVETVTALRELGVTIALDDFGTGYSSLSYVAGFPLDKLKIDQSFVRKIVSDQTSLTIVQTIMSMSNGLGLKVVAEGIETRDEWHLLRLAGCQQGQGYFFGKPQSAADLLALYQRPTWDMAEAC
ncbi:EAL domain-containing protein [Agrobacterium sp. ES01]|uniref:EAL domain-containing protein n=1 Tax=Agrobacterium sp. ES01 TaxID=3420714 RepID=UPI003D0E3246